MFYSRDRERDITQKKEDYYIYVYSNLLEVEYLAI
jgi:hypothetical protein